MTPTRRRTRWPSTSRRTCHGARRSPSPPVTGWPSRSAWTPRARSTTPPAGPSPPRTATTWWRSGSAARSRSSPSSPARSPGPRCWSPASATRRAAGTASTRACTWACSAAPCWPRRTCWPSSRASRVSAVRMLVLGVVRGLDQAHGYQVRRELMTWRADAWAHVAPASIYQALRTLTKRGLVEEVGTESGGGPERTLYRLTPDGETEFFALVRAGISEPRDTHDELSAAFGFAHLLPRGEVARLLDYRVAALWGQLVRVDPPPGGGAALPDGIKPAQVGALLQLAAGQLRAEIDWALEVTVRIRDGTFTFSEGATSKA